MRYPGEGGTPTNVDVSVGLHWLAAEQLATFPIARLVAPVLCDPPSAGPAAVFDGVGLPLKRHSATGCLWDAEITTWTADRRGGAYFSEGSSEAGVRAREACTADESAQGDSVSAVADSAGFRQPPQAGLELDAALELALALGTGWTALAGRCDWVCTERPLACSFGTGGGASETWWGASPSGPQSHQQQEQDSNSSGHEEVQTALLLCS